MDTLVNQPTKGHVKQALQHLAKGIDGLDETYNLAMNRIRDQSEGFRELANRMLGWIVHAKRPLSTTELQQALGVRLHTQELNEDFLPSIPDLTSRCAGLVTIDEQSGIVRLIHYTTQEYFTRTWAGSFSDAQMDIANVCVTYLSFEVFEAGFCESDREFEERLRTNVLYDYAARNWGYHAYTASIAEDSILNLLESRAKVSAASQAMMVEGDYPDYSQGVPMEMTGAHVAAYFGLVDTIMGLLKKGHNPHLQDSYGRTPLSWAAENGHKAVVKLLLEAKADVNAKDNKGQTPLWCAARNGHEAVVKLLLEAKADVDAKDNGGRTPLWCAARNGHEAVVKLLLEAKADAKDEYDGHTPLPWAAVKGHEVISS
jgi:hypothetical protein